MVIKTLDDIKLNNDKKIKKINFKIFVVPLMVIALCGTLVSSGAFIYFNDSIDAIMDIPKEGGSQRPQKLNSGPTPVAIGTPTVNGLYYGDGDEDNYYFLRDEDNARGFAYYNLINNTFYLLVIVNETVNDNVFGDLNNASDKDYVKTTGWQGVGNKHRASDLIGSDHIEIQVQCCGTLWHWKQDYAYNTTGTWLSDPYGNDGAVITSLPPGLVSNSSLVWNLDNSAWDYTLGGSRGDSSDWKSPDEDGDNNVTDENYPGWNDNISWEWAMIYEMSFNVSVCGSCPVNVTIVSSHNSPVKDGGAEDVPINTTTLMDYGDAPDPTKPTLNASNGARHYILANEMYLGSSVDSDVDGQPNANATGDDTLDGNDDEDGVVFTTDLVPCEQANVTITASKVGQLDAWIDFNDDCDWADPGEQIFTNVTLAAGANALNFTVPCNANLTNQTFARFRFSSNGSLNYYGLADDGEVEDYAIEIIETAPSPEIEVIKTVWNGTHWVDLTYGTVGGTARFNISVHNNGTEDLIDLNITDYLPDCLRYANNATVDGSTQEPNETWNSGMNFAWHIPGPLAYCEYIYIEFNTTIVTNGTNINLANATGTGNQTNTTVYDEDNATVEVLRSILGSISDYVWIDTDKDGIQEASENGVGGVIVELYDGMGNFLQQTITDNTGYYIFFNLTEGNYSLRFLLPAGYSFTLKGMGNVNDDSNTNETGWTDIILLGQGENNVTIDTGIFSNGNGNGGSCPKQVPSLTQMGLMILIGLISLLAVVKIKKKQ